MSSFYNFFVRHAPRRYVNNYTRTLFYFILNYLYRVPDIPTKIQKGESFKARLLNIKTKEYLSPTVQDYSEDARRRRVLALKQLKDDDKDANKTIDWIIEPVHGGKESSIRLINAAFEGEYLLAGTDDLSLDATKRKVYTWKEKGMSQKDFDGWGSPEEWCLIPLPAAQDAGLKRFRLRNVKFEEDLFANGECFLLDDQLGNVYTWRDQEHPCCESGSDGNVWEIIQIP